MQRFMSMAQWEVLSEAGAAGGICVIFSVLWRWFKRAAGTKSLEAARWARVAVAMAMAMAMLWLEVLAERFQKLECLWKHRFCPNLLLKQERLIRNATKPDWIMCIQTSAIRKQNTYFHERNILRMFIWCIKYYRQR